MKKSALIVLIIGSLLLSGCSLLGEVNESIEYANTVTDHIEKLTTFAEEVPKLMQSADIDAKVKEELEARVLTLKQDIEGFIALSNIPSTAEEIHQELVEKNEVLLDEINKVLENGNLALDKLQHSEIFTILNEITSLKEQIENLGQ